MNHSPKATPTPRVFANFAQIMTHLETVGLFHMDLRLTRTQEACKALVPAPTMQVVQVVGTNGKGSTSTLLAALAQSHGLCTGLYTSPHFVSPRERIRIDNRLLPESLWLDLANRLHPVAPTLTYFEFLTVLALMAFQQAGVQIAIMEAGLGGRHDATTALPVHMICYTPIAMDHETILGDSLVEIAADKADAMRGGVPVVTAPQKPEVLACLRRKAASAGNVLYQADAEQNLPPLALRGPHQKINAGLALTAWRLLARRNGWLSSAKAGQESTLEATALREAFVPGRLQYIPAQGADSGHAALLLDGGHNPHGMEALAHALQEASVRPAVVIFSCLADKNFAGMCAPLLRAAGPAPILVPTIADNPRATPAAQLTARIGGQARECAGLTAALAEAQSIVQRMNRQDGCILICGSLYLLAEFFHLFPHFLEKPLPAPAEPA